MINSNLVIKTSWFLMSYIAVAKFTRAICGMMFNDHIWVESPQLFNGSNLCLCKHHALCRCLFCLYNARHVPTKIICIVWRLIYHFNFIRCMYTLVCALHPQLLLGVYFTSIPAVIVKIRWQFMLLSYVPFYSNTHNTPARFVPKWDAIQQWDYSNTKSRTWMEILNASLETPCKS